MHPQLAVTFAEEVRRGLLASQKSLPTKYLYDDVGSALFDAITELPEYGLTRADLRLLRQHAGSIARHCAETSAVVELGSGNGTKTRALLAGFPDTIIYRPVDISRAALERCSHELNGYKVEPIQADFLTGLQKASEHRDGARLLIAFLGSNIGNFDRADIPGFLTDIRECLQPGDTFLLGADLVKPVEQLVPAYDDPPGVTAAFNRNLLARINRELDGNFVVRCFDHEARWNAEARRMEMHLRSRSAQRVTLRAIDLEVSIAAGETIFTESSNKFAVNELIEMAKPAGFAIIETWTDAEWPFAELLFRA